MIKESDVVRGFKIICISMYLPALKQLDEMVAALRARGVGNANRSSLIRYALRKIDIESVTHEDL